MAKPSNATTSQKLQYNRTRKTQLMQHNGVSQVLARENLRENGSDWGGAPCWGAEPQYDKKRTTNRLENCPVKNETS